MKKLENKLKEHDYQIVQIIQVINQLITPPQQPKRKIGFTNDYFEKSKNNPSGAIRRYINRSQCFGSHSDCSSPGSRPYCR